MGLVVPGIGMLFGSGNPVSGLCADDEADDVAVAAGGVVVAGVAASVSVGPMEVLTDCGRMKSVLKRPSHLGCAGVPFRELKILKLYFSVGGSRLIPLTLKQPSEVPTITSFASVSLPSHSP